MNKKILSEHCKTVNLLLKNFCLSYLGTANMSFLTYFTTSFKLQNCQLNQPIITFFQISLFPCSCGTKLCETIVEFPSKHQNSLLQCWRFICCAYANLWDIATLTLFYQRYRRIRKGCWLLIIFHVISSVKLRISLKLAG